MAHGELELLDLGRVIAICDAVEVFEKVRMEEVRERRREKFESMNICDESIDVQKDKFNQSL